MGSMEPAPTSPTLRTCASVDRPATSREANTIHSK